MIRFPLVDLALEGFRLTREQPKAVAVWALALFVANLAFLTAMVALGLGPLIAAASALQPAPPDTVARGADAALWLPGVFALYLGVNVVLYTGVLRAVLEPARARFAYLRLGAQELRQILLWIYVVVALAAFQLLLFSVESATEAAGAAMDPAGGRLVSAIVAVGLFLAVFYPVVRLSIAPAMTFAEGRVRLFSAWSLTGGQFWGMVGAYAVAALLALAVMLLASVILAALITVVVTIGSPGPAPADALQRIGQPDYATVRGFLAPATLAAVASNAVLMAMALVILAAPGPVIYLALKGRPTTKA